MEVKLEELSNPLNKMINSYGNPFYQLLFFEYGVIKTFHFSTKEKAEKYARKILNEILTEKSLQLNSLDIKSTLKHEHCVEKDCEECEDNEIKVKSFGYIHFIKNRIEGCDKYIFDKIKEDCPFDTLNDIIDFFGEDDNIDLFCDNMYFKIEEKHFLDE